MDNAFQPRFVGGVGIALKHERPVLQGSEHDGEFDAREPSRDSPKVNRDSLITWNPVRVMRNLGPRAARRTAQRNGQEKRRQIRATSVIGHEEPLAEHESVRIDSKAVPWAKAGAGMGPATHLCQRPSV